MRADHEGQMLRVCAEFVQSLDFAWGVRGSFVESAQRGDRFWPILRRLACRVDQGNQEEQLGATKATPVRGDKRGPRYWQRGGEKLGT